MQIHSDRTRRTPTSDVARFVQAINRTLYTPAMWVAEPLWR